jgi:HSP20 family protein
MAEAATKLPVSTAEKKETAPAPKPSVSNPFESLRREIDHLFEDFDRGFWRSPFRRSAFDVAPFWRPEISWGSAPAVDIVDKDSAYEVTAELPGLDASNIDVKLSEGMLTIHGEKKDEKEEKKKDYYLSERRYGAFERRFHVPEGVDAEKIAASFKNGVLTLTLPKTAEAQKAVKKIDVKAS